MTMVLRAYEQRNTEPESNNIMLQSWSVSVLDKVFNKEEVASAAEQFDKVFPLSKNMFDVFQNIAFITGKKQTYQIYLSCYEIICMITSSYKYEWH